MTVTIPEDGYVSVVDTAKLIRKALKAEFPAVKFSVRSDKYAGGASIDVSWTDGPTESAVETITSAFSGKGFDGMIDLAYSTQSWLEDDGTATFAYSPGTQGNAGVNPERIGSRRTPGARLVHFGADYVFTNRALSAEFVARVEAALDRPAMGECVFCRRYTEDGFVVTNLHRGHRSERIACGEHAARIHASSVTA